MICSDLRQRITFLKPSPSENTDTLNARTVDYIEYKTVWASVLPMSGKEYAEAQKLRSETTYNVIVRYRPDITTDMKIRYGKKELNIISVLNIGERKEILKIIAAETDTNGKNDSDSGNERIGGGFFGG